MKTLATIHYLADGATGGSSSGVSAANTFWTTPAGNVISSILAVVGIVIVIIAIIQIAKKVMKGAPQGAFGVAVMGLVLAAICFQPQLIDTAINAFSGLVSAVISTLGNIFNSGGGN